MNKPFLKWAGGKTKAVDRIKEMLPPARRLFEPFVGSGALFLNTDYPVSILSDSNARLMELYVELRMSREVILDAEELFVPENNTPEYYYATRALFNAGIDFFHTCPAMVYLNRHCYNGLWRENSAGQFNVPFGKYTEPYFPMYEMEVAHKKLERAHLLCGDFEAVMDMAEGDSVIYGDPPFIPLGGTADFVTYSKGGFGAQDHLRLRDAAVRAQARGVTVVISNHDVPAARELYAGADEIVSFPVQRNISCNGEGRHKVNELLVLYQGKKTQSVYHQYGNNISNMVQ